MGEQAIYASSDTGCGCALFAALAALWVAVLAVVLVVAVIA